MKRHLTALFLTAVMVVSAVVTPAWAAVTAGEDELPDVGEEIYGFKVTDRGEYRAAEAETVTFSHIKSGATLFLIKNDDKNRAFIGNSQAINDDKELFDAVIDLRE